MPQVPYVPYPTAEPTTQGTPSIRISTPPQAFGENIAKAVEGFGLGLEQDSDKIFNRAIAMQELQNETIARNADTVASQKMGVLHAQFQTQLGLNAGPQALEKYTKDLTAVYQDGRASLPNDDARRRYDANALSVLNRSIFNGAGHSGEQVKQAYMEGAQAQIKSIASNVYESSLVTRKGEPVNLDQSIAQVRQAAEGYADMKGFTPEGRKEFVDQQVSTVIAHMLAGTARNRPQEAADLQDKYGAQLHGDDQIRVDNTIQDRTRTIQSKIEVDKILNPAWSAGPDEKMPTEKDLRQQVDAMADKLHPDDPLFKDAARNYFRSRFGALVAEQKNQEFNNRQTVEGALLGNFSQGKIPQTVDELTAIPEVQSAWGQLPNSTQRRYKNVLADIVSRGQKVDPYASLQARQEYVGQAQNNPQAFLDADFMTDKRLSIADMKYIAGLKNQVFKAGGADPKVSHALQVLRPDLDNAGITRTADPLLYDRLTGVMHDWMGDYIAEHKKAPKDQEILDAGRRLIQQQAKPGAIFGSWWPNQIRPIEDVPTQEQLDTIRSDIKSRDPTYNPSDEEIIRAVAKNKLKKMFDQAKPSGEHAGEKWNPDTMKWESGEAK